MTGNKRRKLAWAIAGIVVLLVAGLKYWSSGPQIRIASAFTAQDVRAIRSVVGERRRAEIWKSVSTLDFKRLWNYSLPVLFSRTEVIAGFPGPPGGASVQCSGLFSDTRSGFMVFNTTNGWRCDYMYFVDAKSLRRARTQANSPVAP